MHPFPTMKKVMLASDADESKIKYPCCVLPKVDGVRGHHLNDVGLQGRSNKFHANKYTTQVFSHPAFIGIDGELAAEHECHPDLCRLTTSALSRVNGSPYTLWWAFDYYTDNLKNLGFVDRFRALMEKVRQLASATEPMAASRVRLMPMWLVHSHDELLELENKLLRQGYEGIIVRDPDGLYKEGRSTVKEGGLLRIKRFVEEEATVLSLEEGYTNMNEAFQNELGLTSRSTHQENLVPNGMIGALICKSLKTGEQITVGAGKLTHAERLHYWQNKNDIIGKVIKYKHFPKGVKEKRRFPTFQSFRVASDM